MTYLDFKLEVRDATILEVRDDTILEVRDATILEVRDATILEVRDATILEVRDATILSDYCMPKPHIHIQHSPHILKPTGSSSAHIITR
jgi:hypothetical protein